MVFYTLKKKKEKSNYRIKGECEDCDFHDLITQGIFVVAWFVERLKL